MKKKRMVLLAVLLVGLLTACGAKENKTIENRDTAVSSSLTYTSSLETSYAKEFAVDYYEDGYALITIADGSRYLVVPEGKKAPKDLSEDITVLQKPLKNMYLVASAVMDMFVSLDALDTIRFSGLQADNWYIPEAREAMQRGDILYAGKYSAPDYEMIRAENCSLAIENTMISHSPEVQEQLERFNIAVLVDRSSYEPEPLGRTEWVKLYGLLTDREKEAEKAFEREEEAFAKVGNADKTGKTVAFFYVTSNGEVNVRKSSDYLPKMIEDAGGKYIFEDLGKDAEKTSTISMQMEEFYAKAKDADYMIYNSTIDGELDTLEDLLAKSPLLQKCKAVQEGHVYCTTKNLYQSTMSLGTITGDIHRMLENDDMDLVYLYRLE